MRLAVVRRELPESGDWALDLGTGGPKQHFFEDFYLHSGFKHILGIEVHEPWFEWRRNAYPGDRYHWLCTPAEAYVPDRDFDLCTVNHVIEHLDEGSVPMLLERLRSRCKFIFAETPDQFEDGSGAASLFGNDWMRHKWLTTPEFMETAGFQRIYWYWAGSFSNSGYIWRQ